MFFFINNFKAPHCSPARSYARSTVLPYSYYRDTCHVVPVTTCHSYYVPPTCSSYYYPYLSAAAKAEAAAAAADAATATAAELSKDLADTVVRKNAEISDISQKYEKELAEIEENLKKENEHKEKIKNELLILEFYYYYIPPI